MIIDFHTHIFPDQVAKNAIPFLEKEGEVKAILNGTKQDLIASMDKAKVDKSVVCSIATKPSHFQSIFDWSQQIRSQRLFPFPSVHPEDHDAVEKIEQIKEAGFLGMKMHPYYQDFYLDEKRMEPIFHAISNAGLVLLMHTGFDIAFPHERRADPARIVHLTNTFPKLKLVTSHLGAWSLWNEVNELIAGKPIYMDISYALEFLDMEFAREILLKHPKNFILYASDSPWSDQQATMELVYRLNLGREIEDHIFGLNAQHLLGLTL